jgi:hypothetical protein
MSGRRYNRGGTQVPILGGPKSDPIPQRGKPTPDNGPWVRLLKCYDCKSLEVIGPMYWGNPDDDSALQYVSEPHLRKDHKGNVPIVHEQDWEDQHIKRAIVERLWDDVVGFRPSYYDIKDTFKDDAGKCFIAHHRSVPCIDWRDSTKLLSNPAAKERRWLARETKHESVQHSGIKRYLCDFCPVAQTVLDRQREAGYNVGDMPR